MPDLIGHLSVIAGQPIVIADPIGNLKTRQPCVIADLIGNL